MSDGELQQIFASYHSLAAQADALFEQVRDGHAENVACSTGCSDCCHALFDISLVEAMALNRAFNEKFGFGPDRSAILQAAGEADRAATRLKRGYYQQARQGLTDEEIMAAAAKDRLRCPLLSGADTCLLYEARPITCRLYGVPTAIHGKAHVCGKCTFTQGQAYPTVALDRLQDKLADLSRRIAQAVNSRFQQLHTVYVPVSMALVTKYDDAYLGIGDPPKEPV